MLQANCVCISMIFLIPPVFFLKIYAVTDSLIVSTSSHKFEKFRLSVNNSEPIQIKNFLKFHSPLKSLISLFWHFTFFDVLYSVLWIQECCYCYFCRTEMRDELECEREFDVLAVGILYFIFEYEMSCITKNKF